MKPEKTEKKPFGKTLLLFVGFLAVCLAAGFLTGFGMAEAVNRGFDPLAWVRAVEPFVGQIAFGLYILTFAVQLIWGFGALQAGKRLFRSWNGEEEEGVRKAESAADRCVEVTNVCMVVELFLFALYTAGMRTTPVGVDVGMFVLFFGSFGILIWQQRSAVELCKKINPEKRGEMLDFHFQKEWNDSLDEAEREMMGKAAVKAMRAVGTVCMILWVLSIIGILFLDLSVVPALFVTVIWLTMIITLQRSARKMEYGKS